MSRFYLATSDMLGRFLNALIMIHDYGQHHYGHSWGEVITLASGLGASTPRWRRLLTIAALALREECVLIGVA